MLLPVDAAIVSLAASGWMPPAYCAPIDATAGADDSRPALRSSCERLAADLAGDKDDPVITPGGPRRRDQVHPVRPGEVVRQNEDGTFTVVPKDAPAGPKPQDPNKDKNKNTD